MVPQCCTVNQSINNFHDAWFLLMLHTGTFKPQYYYVAPPRYDNGVVPHNNTSQLWELEAGICCPGPPPGSVPMLHCFNFEKVDGSNLLEAESIWSIDAIGFCFARVMWRSMASVLVFFQHILICGAFTCTWSKEVVQTFSQVQQYRLCIRDFTLFVLRMRHICFGGC